MPNKLQQSMATMKHNQALHSIMMSYYSSSLLSKRCFRRCCTWLFV